MKKLFQSLMLVVWLLFTSLLFAMHGDDILGEWVTDVWKQAGEDSKT